MIIHSQWSFNDKLKIMMDVITRNKSIKEASHEHSISTSEISGWIKSLYQTADFVVDTVSHNQIIIKDYNHVITGANLMANALGSKCRADKAIGKTDKEITPEFSDIYVDNGQKVLDAKIPLKLKAPVFCNYVGWVDAVSQTFPILDDNGEAKAILFHQKIDYRLKKYQFSTIVKALYEGFGRLFVQKIQYLYTTTEGKIVYFSQREAECLLSLLVGMPLKLVAHHMNVSSKTIEKMIAIMCTKVGASTRMDLIKRLLDGQFFESY